jgi:hypothetical protein
VNKETIMADTLCEIWTALAAHPDDPVAVANARAELVALLEHVDDCDACRAISEQITDPERVFAALSEGGVSLSDDELSLVQQMDQAAADDENDIVTAVQEVLLPGNGLDSPGDIAPGISHVQLFLALDAVNLLVRSYASRAGGKPVELSNAGLRIGDDLVARRSAMLGEIQLHAEIDDDAAERLWSWQLDVAEQCPRLYRGLRVTRAFLGLLEVELEKSGSTRDLVARWAVRLEEPVAAELPARRAVPALKPVSVYVENVLFLNHDLMPKLEAASLHVSFAADKQLTTILNRKIVDVTKEQQKIGALCQPYVLACFEMAAQSRAAARPAPKVDARGVVAVMKTIETEKMMYFEKILDLDPAIAAKGTVNLKPLQAFAKESIQGSRVFLATLDKYQ